MRARGRKRSAAITLVLAGSATLAGCGSPVEQRDAYSTRQACLQDWQNPALCEPVKDGRYASNYFYGPPYYAQSSGWRFFGRDRVVGSPNAMETSRLSSGSVARSSTGQLAMRTGAGPSTSVSRGGFGSSGHSAGSSSS
jgi:uncharacterized protein YgiB involved in biofilm formation